MRERPPTAILFAMGVAIAGAAVTSALDFWFAVTDPSYLDGLERTFAILNLSLGALNVALLVGIWRHAELAWAATYALVVMGAVLDATGAVFPYVEFGNFGGVLQLGSIVARNIDWLSAGLFWSWVHLIVIQAPILVLLSLKTSRRWVGIDLPVVRS